uniref:MSCRAMM family protein n=1 Tax=Clostridium sp. NkU-1 TaxID=1095009 RepID=UPI003261C124
MDQQKSVVIPDFETTDKAIDITGRLTAGKTYYLHEVKAPSGYYLSADVAFTMPEAAELLKVTMTDSKKQNHGSDKMHLNKVDAATGQGIEGVEFSIYHPDGSLYLTVDTDKNGYAKFDIPANGTYTYKETKAAPGYLLTDHIYSFTIKNGEVSENSIISVVNHPSPEVLIQKADAVTWKRLAGAVLEIRNEAGMPVFTGITDESGQLSFQPLHVGKYTVHEIKAPEGYIKTDAYLTIQVKDAGAATGEFVMYNSPEQVKKKGFITAAYQSSLNSFGIINHRGKGYWGWLSRLPKTGDIGMGGGLLLVIGLSGIVSGIIFVRRKRDKKDEK